jgi:hypothetical protein
MCPEVQDQKYPLCLSCFKSCLNEFLSDCFKFGISGFRREVDENCALLGYYATSSGKFLQTFRDNLSIPFSGFKNKIFFITKMVPIGCPETSVKIYRSLLHNNPKERRFVLFKCSLVSFVHWFVFSVYLIYLSSHKYVYLPVNSPTEL